jgi:hypothetical protein
MSSKLRPVNAFVKLRWHEHESFSSGSPVPHGAHFQWLDPLFIDLTAAKGV